MSSLSISWNNAVTLLKCGPNTERRNVKIWKTGYVKVMLLSIKMYRVQ